MTSPSDEIAEKIAARLLAEKLILPADSEEFSKAMAQGTAKESDWRLIIEKAIDKQAAQ